MYHVEQGAPRKPTA